MKQLIRSMFDRLGYTIQRKPSLEAKAGVFDEDCLITSLNHDFVSDPRFIKAYEAGKATGAMFPGRWRFHVALWAAQHAAKLPGDFVECGVNNGSFSKAILTYLPWEDLSKSFYLFDTWAGFDIKQLKAEEISLGVLERYSGYDDGVYESVVETFGRHSRVKLYRGSVPQTLAQAQIEKVSYLSIDMNCSAPEISAAEYFWDMLVPGAVIVLDDYGFNGSHMVQKRAFDGFASTRGTEVLSLPTGQGLIFKI